MRSSSILLAAIALTACDRVPSGNRAVSVGEATKMAETAESNFTKGDVKAVMAQYADNAVLIDATSPNPSADRRVQARWAQAGLIGGEALLGQAAPDGSESPYFAIGIIHFDSEESLQAALNGEHASEIIGDISNFTNAEPVIQLNERFLPRS